VNRTFAKVVALVVFGCAALGVLLHTLNAANHRPEGLAERWLHAVSDTGRSGIRDDALRRAAKLGPVALAASLVPADHDSRKAYFTDLEVGRARRAADVARVPYRLHPNARRGSPPTRDGTVVMARAGDTWRVAALDARHRGERVPSEGGEPPSRAPLASWVGAVLLGVCLAAGSHAIVRYADRTAAAATAALLLMLGTACGGTLEGKYKAETRAPGTRAGTSAGADVTDDSALTTGATTNTTTGAGASAAGPRSASGVTAPVVAPAAEQGAQFDSSDIGVTKNEIKVGGTTVLSGPIADFGKEGLYGADARIQAANARGGVNGRTIKLIFYDDKFDGAQGLNYFHKLVEQDKIFSSIGSSSVDAIADYICRDVARLQGAPLPLIGDLGLSPKSYAQPRRYPCLFASGSGSFHANWVRGQHAASVGAKSIAVIYSNESQLGDIKVRVAKEREAYEAHGLRVTRMEPYTPGDTNCTPAILNVRQGNPDFLFTELTAPTDQILCLQAMQNQGYKPAKGVELNSPLAVFLKAGGTFTEGMVAQSIFRDPNDSSPGMREYQADMQKYHPDVDRGDEITLSYYLSSKVNIHLIGTLGRNVTRKRLLDAANTLSGWDSGMGPVIAWSPDNHAGFHSQLYAVARNGRFEHANAFIASDCPPSKCVL
jgi:branched-chain amino acid transport system substrate-binding protein